MAVPSHSDSTTFKLEEVWNIGQFSSLIQDNLPLKRRLTARNFDSTPLCTFELQLHPNGSDTTTAGNVSLFLNVTFPSNVKRIVWVERKFYIIEENGAKIKIAEDTSQYDITAGSWGYPKFAAHPGAELNSDSQSWLNDRLIIHFEGIVSVLHFVSNDLSLDMQHLLHTEAYSDVAFSLDGTLLKAHKAILSARSPVFAQMFSPESLTTEVEEGKVIILEDVQKDVFCQFLLYLYGGVIPAHELVTPDLLVLADKYQVDLLKEACERILPTWLTVDNLGSLLRVAHLQNAPLLKAGCIAFMVQNAFQVTHSPEWEKITETQPKLSIQVVRLLTQPKEEPATLVKPSLSTETESIIFHTEHTWRIDDIVSLVENSSAAFPTLSSANFAAPGHEQIQFQLQLSIEKLASGCNSKVETSLTPLVKNRKATFNLASLEEPSGERSLTGSNVAVSLILHLGATIKKAVSLEATFSLVDQNQVKRWPQQLRKQFQTTGEMHQIVFPLDSIYILNKRLFYLSKGQIVIHLKATVHYESFNFSKHMDKLAQDMDSLLMSSKHSDANLKFSNAEDSVKVHQCILSVRSPVLSQIASVSRVTPEAAENGATLPEKSILPVGSSNTEAYQVLLRFLYTGVLPEGKALNFALLASALKHKLASLQYACESHLAALLSIDTIIDSLQFAHHENAPYLKEQCLSFILAHAQMVTKATKWKTMEAQPALLNEIICALAGKLSLL